MYPLVYKYLVQFKSVSIPGIGNFYVQTSPASFLADANLLVAPQMHIVYKSETALADKRFYEFLAHELQIDEVKAIKAFHEYAYDLKTALGKSEAVTFNGVGTLAKQPDGSYLFQEDNGMEQYFVPVQAQLHKAITEQPAITNSIDDETQESQTFLTGQEALSPSQALPNPYADITEADLTPVPNEVQAPKDLWWLWAIVMAVLAIAAILYKLS